MNESARLGSADTAHAQPLDIRAPAKEQVRRSLGSGVVLHGLALFLVLATFRIQRVLIARASLSGVEWLQVVVTDLGPVLILQAALAALGLLTLRRKAVGWTIGALVTHLLIVAAAVIEHQFFVKTGTWLDRSVLFYSIRHFGQLRGLMASGVDQQLVLFLFLAGLVAAFAALLRRKERAAFAIRWSNVGVLACLGIGLQAATVAGPAASSFGRNPLAIFARAGGESSAAEDGHVVDLREYAPPALTSVGRKPNIVFVLLESTRRDVSLGVEPEQSATPFLHRVAGQGLVVEDFYTTVSHTSKTLIGILCGMYATLSMEIVESSASSLPLKCLPHLLGGVGYRTGFFQSARGSFEQRPNLLRNVGFDEWKVAEDLLAPGFQKLGYLALDEYAMLEPALSWLSKEPEKPFFLTLLTASTHHPYHVPGKQPPNSRDGYFPSYLEAVARVDGFLEALLRRMYERRLLDNTVIFILGDHGEAFGEHHGRYQHDLVPYEEVTRSPLAIIGPDWLGAPRTIRGLRSQLDLLPTVLDLMSAGWTGSLPGRSLLSTPGHDRLATYCWYENRCASLRWGKLKFVYHYNALPTEVYDVGEDPRELRNLAQEVPAQLINSAVARIHAQKRLVDEYYAQGRAQAKAPPSE